jgi:hypothetical protein
MPKLEKPSNETELTPLARANQLSLGSPIGRSLTEKIVHAAFLSDHSRERAEEESLLRKYTAEGQLLRSRTLRLDLDETDILKSGVEIHEDGRLPRFKALYYLMKVVLTYALLVGVNELYKLSVALPYFLMIAIYAFFDSLSPFKWEHLLLMLAYPLLIGNVFLRMEFLSYPSILICYLGVAAFQKTQQVRNLLIIWMFVVIFLYGWYALPALYGSLQSSGLGFVYIYAYPLLDLGVELLLDLTLLVIHVPQLLYYELYLFLLGLQFGTALAVQLTSVEFWYLCVIYAIRLVNARKQFLVGLLRRGLVRLAFLNIAVQKRTIEFKSGFLAKFTLHSVALIYIYSYLLYNNYPYSSLGKSMIELYSGTPWYQPLVVLGVLLFYELICIKMDPAGQKRRRILFEFEEQTILSTVRRGLINVFGLWMFYVGFMVPSQQVKYS